MGAFVEMGQLLNLSAPLAPPPPSPGSVPPDAQGNCPSGRVKRTPPQWQASLSVIPDECVIPKSDDGQPCNYFNPCTTVCSGQGLGVPGVKIGGLCSVKPASNFNPGLDAGEQIAFQFLQQKGALLPRQNIQIGPQLPVCGPGVPTPCRGTLSLLTGSASSLTCPPGSAMTNNGFCRDFTGRGFCPPGWVLQDVFAGCIPAARANCRPPTSLVMNPDGSGACQVGSLLTIGPSACPAGQVWDPGVPDIECVMAPCPAPRPPGCRGPMEMPRSSGRVQRS